MDVKHPNRVTPCVECPVTQSCPEDESLRRGSCCQPRIAADSANGRSTLQTFLFCLGLCLVASLLMALTRQEFVNGFHKASLHRYTDIQVYVHHQLNSSAENLHPVWGGFLRWNRTAPVVLALSLARMGVPEALAINLTVLAMRVVFGLAVSWLFFAASGKRHLAVLGVLLAYVLPSNANIYGHAPQYAFTGFLSTSCFLLACACLLRGSRRSAMLWWLLQFWVHPTTFVTWSPIFIGLFLLTDSRTREGFSRHLRAYGALLVVAPTVVALLSGLLERAGLLPFQADDYYWALTRVKSNHCVFMFSSTYVLAIQYFAEAAALLILARGGLDRCNPLTPLNLLAGLGGMGIGVMYAATVETHFSVVANMCLPLRFECVMYPLILANVVRDAFCSPTENRRISLLAVLYGMLLLFPQLKPLLWAWVWALGRNCMEDGPGSLRTHARWFAAGTAVVVACLVLGPSGRPVRWNVEHGLPFVTGGLLVIGAIALAWRLNRNWPRLTYAAACVACLLIAPRIWMTNTDRFIEEVNAVARRQPEKSAEKTACDWINSHLAPGTPVLGYNAMYVHRLTQINTSVNKDIIEYFVYAPRFARPLADELRDLYGVDVLSLAARRERLNLTRDDWLRVRMRVLNDGHTDKRAFDYVIEPSHMPLADASRVVFCNGYARVYEVGRPLARAR